MAETKKEQIVSTALRRFAHFGYHKTSMNEIAEDLRITKANLYYYYSDKAALLKDCTNTVIDELIEREDEIISHYECGKLIKTIDDLLCLFADYAKEYYMFELHEKVELIKEISLHCIVEEFDNRNVQNFKHLFTKAIHANELKLDDVNYASRAFCEIMKGISVMNRVSDMLKGIPNLDNIDKILESQKMAARFILEGKIIKQ